MLSLHKINKKNLSPLFRQHDINQPWLCALYLVLQLYLDDREAKVIPVERSPPSLSSSLLSCAGTAVNRGPLLLLLNKECVKRQVIITLVWPGGGAAVLDVAHAPCDLPLVTVTRLPEALLKVVREEGVQHRVYGRVGVLEAVREQDNNHQGVALVETGLLTKIESRLDYRVRQTFCCFSSLLSCPKAEILEGFLL